MQTSFYTSGFLYNPKTNQILLLKSQQKDTADYLWSTFGGEGSEGEEAQAVFQRVVSELLNLNLKTKDIYPVYDYFQDEKDKNNYVFYAEVKKSKDLDSIKGDALSWITFAEISKLSLTSHSKQDVIVGERVINAKWREDEAKKTPQTES